MAAITKTAKNPSLFQVLFIFVGLFTLCFVWLNFINHKVHAQVIPANGGLPELKVTDVRFLEPGNREDILVRVNGKDYIFHDKDEFDDKLNYKNIDEIARIGFNPEQAGVGAITCKGESNLDLPSSLHPARIGSFPNSVSNVTLTLKTCSADRGPITVRLTNIDRAQTFFSWVDKETIRLVGESNVYRLTEEKNVFSSGDKRCDAKLVVRGNNATYYTLTAVPGSTNPVGTATAAQLKSGNTNDIGCLVTKVNFVSIDNNHDVRNFSSLVNRPGSILANQANRNLEPGQGAGIDGEGSEGISCDVSLASPLSWILCPLIEQGSNFVDFVFSDIVRPLLAEVPISTDSNDGGFRAWQQFRIIGNIVLVGTLLAVVYAQVRGDR